MTRLAPYVALWSAIAVCLSLALALTFADPALPRWCHLVPYAGMGGGFIGMAVFIPALLRDTPPSPKTGGAQ